MCVDLLSLSLSLKIEAVRRVVMFCAADAAIYRSINEGVVFAQYYTSTLISSCVALYTILPAIHPVESRKLS